MLPILLLLLLLQISAASIDDTKEKCPSLEEDIQYMRWFIEKQEAISSLPTGRIILQMMQKMDSGQESVELLRRLKRESLVYRRQVRKTLEKFLESPEVLYYVPETISLLGLFLLEEDCLLLRAMEAGKRERLLEEIRLYRESGEREKRKKLLSSIIIEAREVNRQLCRSCPRPKDSL